MNGVLGQREREWLEKEFGHKLLENEVRVISIYLSHDYEVWEIPHLLRNYHTNVAI